MSLPRPPLAVTGLSALFPGSRDKAGFWRDILEGRDLIGDVPETHWLVADYYDPDPQAPDKTYARRGAFLSPIDFDPIEFGIPPNVVPATDTSQLLALIAAKQVLDDAVGGQFAHVDRERTSVILGVTSAQELLVEMGARLQRPVWVRALREHGLGEDEVERVCDRIAASYTPWQENTFPGLLGNVVAGRIANRLDLGGTNCITDAACASSFSALQMGANELYLGQSDLVIVGGVEAFNDIFMYMCFSKTPALSPSGDCRPFAKSADGTMLGEGIGMLALRRQEDAERDGDRIYALLRGIGSSSDGRSKSVYAPAPEGQAKALRRAYEAAGYSPATVELVEAHGTGTKAGDVAEFEGLRQVFEASGRPTRQWCALGSVKSQVGHTKAAAGAAGLFKTVMALHHKVLPPTLKVDEPHPGLLIAKSPFYLNTRARPWVRDAAHPRRASVSSFGFGGSNFHVTAEEYTGGAARPARIASWPAELLVFAEKDPPALLARCRAVLRQAAAEVPLAWLARDSHERLDSAQPARLAVVAEGAADLQRKLESALQAVESEPAKAFASPGGACYALGATAGKIAFLFPGQGSQYLEMGAALAMAFPAAREVWDLAAGLALDPPLHQVVHPPPSFSQAEQEVLERRLTATEWAQPAIGACSAALLAVLGRLGVTPDAVAGHSFGEVTALFAAGAFDLPSFLRVARRRGELMAEAARTPGAMLAVAASQDDVSAALSALGGRVVVANHNAPRQVVLSGPLDAIDAAAEALGARGLTARRLNVATAFHSKVVAGSAAPFREFLDTIDVAAARARAYSNAEAAPYPEAPDGVRALLAEQIARPVRFVEMVEALHKAGVATFVEVGPGAVLTSLVGEILHGVPHLSVSLDRKGRHAVTGLWHGLARLAVQGVPLDLPRLLEEFARPAPAEPRRKPGLSLQISGANYAKPYPPAGGAAALPKPNPPRDNAPSPRVVESPPLADLLPGRDVTTGGVQATEAAQAAGRAPAMGLAVSGAGATGVAAGTTAAGAAEAGGPAGAAGPAAVAALEPAAEVPRSPAAAAVPDASRTPAEQALWPFAGADAPPWLLAYSEVQRQTAEAHEAYLRATTEAHAAYLKAAEASFGAMRALLSGEPVIPDAVRTASTPAQKDTPAAGLPEVEPGAQAPWSVPVLPREQPRAQREAPGAEPEGAPTRPETPSASRVPQSERLLDTADLKALLLDVVSDKTGYPSETLSFEMELESDLGIDSIKRVEILAALQERVPGLPDVKPAEVAALRTLGQVVAFLERGRADAAPTPRSEPARALRSEPASPVSRSEDAVSPGPLPHVGASGNGEMKSALLAVVAEKTGYPADLLSLEMELESDLGIDSIKRVEILAALQERVPGLPDVKAAEMAALRTLGQIVARMHGTATAAPRTAAVVEPADGPKPRQKPAPLFPLGRFTLREREAPPLGAALTGIRASGPVLVTEDGQGIAPALAELLRAAGVDARAGTQLAPGARAVICLDALRPLASIDDALAAERRVFEVARGLAPAVAKAGGVFVTVQDTGGDFGLGGREPLAAWAAGLPGLVKTAALEWPAAGVRAIDLERGGRSPEALARALADELLAGGPELEVSLRADGRRTRLAHEPAPMRDSAAAGAGEIADDDGIGPESVIVATGGARGVTAACLLALACERRPKLALIGRTPIQDEPAALAGIGDEAGLWRALLEVERRQGRNPGPAELRAASRAVLANREVRRNLVALEQAGSHTLYLAADVRSPGAVAAALEQVRRALGPITGLVHGAGVIADKRIEAKTDEQWRNVFETKVLGLRHLLEAAHADPLRLLCVFSSVAGRFGNEGQCDYAMANEALAKVAAAEAHRRGAGCRVRALHWGPWDGGMVDAGLKAQFHRRGVPLVPMEAGARQFVRELTAAGPEIEVVLGEVPAAPPASDRRPPLEFHVSAASHAFLDGHRVQGVPVLPAALALEWMARAAAAHHPDLVLSEIEELRVLRGIQLLRFEDGGETFVVGCEEAAGVGARLKLEIRAADGTLHYTGLASLRQALPESADPGPAPRASAAPWPLADVYGSLLFHGRSFQVIRALDGLDPHGGEARLSGVREQQWSGGPYRLDVAALDGALQLAILLGHLTLGEPSLPTGIGRLRLFQRQPPTGEIRCRIEASGGSALRLLADVFLDDEQGLRLAELRGVEMHALPERAQPPPPEGVQAALS